jgi:imidazolonepropionase-like amidohydrolase
MIRCARLWQLLTAGGLALAAAPAQDLLPKAPPQPGIVLLKNVTLHTVSGGVVVGGSLWFEDGTIRGVHPAGEPPNLPAGKTPVVFDLSGKHVFPALVSAHSNLGLQEIGMVRQTVDLDELGELSPEALPAVAVNPDSTALPVARSNGVLVAAVFPAGGLMPGRVSVLQLDGWTNTDLVLRAEAGLVVAWPAEPADEPDVRRGQRRVPQAATPGTPPVVTDPRKAMRTARARIDETFAQARAWLDARLVDPNTPVDLRLQAMVPALRGEAPVFVLADELEQIESAVLWANGRQLRCVIVGGRDAPLCSELLVHHRVPVVVDGVHKLPAREDSPYDERFRLPARLRDLGVRFCIATGDNFANERNLPYHAATAAAFGLDRRQALAAITKDAAEILGIGDRMGALAIGLDATLFVANGHILDLPAQVELAFVRGRQVDLRNKQTELAAKYREKYRQLGITR